MKIESIISCAVVVVGTILFTTLLCCKQIGQPSYVVLMSVLALVGIVLYGFNRIREVDLKNLKVTLDKIEQMRDEIYAKAVTVRRLAEDIAEVATLLATDQIPQLIEWGPKSLAIRYEREAARIETKKRVLSILRATDLAPARVQAIEQVFDARIRKTLAFVLFGWLYGLATKVLNNNDQEIQKEFTALRDKGVKQSAPEYQDCLKRAQETQREHQKLNEYVSQQNLEAVFYKSLHGFDALAQYMKAKEIWSPEIETHLKEFREFITRYSVDLHQSEQPPSN